LRDDFGYTIDCLQHQEFLIMQVISGIDPNPYAQVARETDGSFYCEVVSTHHLPEAMWPMDEWALAADGWRPPVGRQTNWSHIAESSHEAAGLLIDALRHGRTCSDPDAYVGTIDRWPPPPSGDAPEPVRPKSPFGVAA
jgi:hypothetical protein